MFRHRGPEWAAASGILCAILARAFARAEGTMLGCRHQCSRLWSGSHIWVCIEMGGHVLKIQIQTCWIRNWGGPRICISTPSLQSTSDASGSSSSTLKNSPFPPPTPSPPCIFHRRVLTYSHTISSGTAWRQPLPVLDCCDTWNGSSSHPHFPTTSPSCSSQSWSFFSHPMGLQIPKAKILSVTHPPAPPKAT